MKYAYLRKRKALETLDFKGFMWLPEKGSIRACGLGRRQFLASHNRSFTDCLPNDGSTSRHSKGLFYSDIGSDSPPGCHSLPIRSSPSFRKDKVIEGALCAPSMTLAPRVGLEPTTHTLEICSAHVTAVRRNAILPISALRSGASGAHRASGRPIASQQPDALVLSCQGIIWDFPQSIANYQQRRSIPARSEGKRKSV